jgi:quinol monooxygenase YgiN
MPYALVNRLATKPGKRDEVLQHLLESGRAFDGNEACLLYLVASSVDEANAIWVVDLWTSEEAHAEALADPTLRPHVEATIPLLEAMPEQLPVDVEGGKLPRT